MDQPLKTPWRMAPARSFVHCDELPATVVSSKDLGGLEILTRKMNNRRRDIELPRRMRFSDSNRLTAPASQRAGARRDVGAASNICCRLLVGTQHGSSTGIKFVKVYSGKSADALTPYLYRGVRVNLNTFAPHLLELDSNLVECFRNDGDENVFDEPRKEEDHRCEVECGSPRRQRIHSLIHQKSPAFG